MGNETRVVRVTNQEELDAALAVARACSIVCVSVFCLKGLMHDE